MKRDPSRNRDRGAHRVHGSVLAEVALLALPLVVVAAASYPLAAVGAAAGALAVRLARRARGTLARRRGATERRGHETAATDAAPAAD